MPVCGARVESASRIRRCGFPHPGSGVIPAALCRGPPYIDGMYTFVVFLHIAAAIVWVGGGLFGQIVGTRLAHGSDDVATAGFARQIEWSGLRLFTPASLVVLAAGIFMVWDNNAWAFSQTWIWLTLVIYALSFIIGAAYLGPTSGKLAKVLEAKGPSDPEFKDMLSRLLTVSRVDALLLLVIVALMVFKPGV